MWFIQEVILGNSSGGTEKWDGERMGAIKCTSASQPSLWATGADTLRGHWEWQNRPQSGPKYHSSWGARKVSSMPTNPLFPSTQRGAQTPEAGVDSKQPSEHCGKCPGAVGGHSCPLWLSSRAFPTVKSEHLRSRKENRSFKKRIYVNYCQMFYPWDIYPLFQLKPLFFFFRWNNHWERSVFHAPHSQLPWPGRAA